MSIWSDIKKAAKGSKEYQKRKKGPISKAAKQVAKDVKSAVKGSKKYQERKKGPISKVAKQVSKDVKSAIKGKKAAPQPFGKAFSSARKAGKKTFTWKGKSYSTKTADDVKKEKKKVTTKPDVKKIVKNIAKSKVKKPKAPKVTAKEWHPPMADSRQPLKPKASEAKSPKEKAGMFGKDREGRSGNYAEGGKVESNPFGWPSSDSRKR